MIGKRVKWTLTYYGSDGQMTYRKGTVIASDGDWFVIKADNYGSLGNNPFIIKRGTEIESI